MQRLLSHHWLIIMIPVDMKNRDIKTIIKNEIELCGIIMNKEFNQNLNHTKLRITKIFKNYG